MPILTTGKTTENQHQQKQGVACLLCMQKMMQNHIANQINRPHI